MKLRKNEEFFCGTLIASGLCGVDHAEDWRFFSKMLRPLQRTGSAKFCYEDGFWFRNLSNNLQELQQTRCCIKCEISNSDQ
jgi:hypothetical protein